MCVTITNVTKMQQGATPMEHVNPPRLGPARGFSHATRAGDLVAQFAQAVRNVGIALEAAGCRPEDAVKLTYYVTDAAGYRANLRPLGEAYRAVFGRHYPASSLFQVAGLFDPEALVEIECIAVRGGGGSE